MAIHTCSPKKTIVINVLYRGYQWLTLMTFKFIITQKFLSVFWSYKGFHAILVWCSWEKLQNLEFLKSICLNIVGASNALWHIHGIWETMSKRSKFNWITLCNRSHLNFHLKCMKDGPLHRANCSHILHSLDFLYISQFKKRTLHHAIYFHFS
jgi:hypothetical protein